MKPRFWGGIAYIYIYMMVPRPPGVPMFPYVSYFSGCVLSLSGFLELYVVLLLVSLSFCFVFSHYLVLFAFGGCQHELCDASVYIHMYVYSYINICVFRAWLVGRLVGWSAGRLVGWSAD